MTAGLVVVAGGGAGAFAAEGPIIDMHVHAFGSAEYGDPAPPNPVTGRAPGFGSDAAALEGMLAAMRQAGIVRAVASGPPAHVRRWRLAAPDAILGGAYTGPRDELPSVEEIGRMAEAGDVSVLGELGLAYRGIDPGDPSLEPWWALAEERGLPVAIHAGLSDAGTAWSCCPGFRARLGNPLLLEDVLVRHPHLKLYLMHAGYPFLQETKAVLTLYPNVYVDLAVIDWLIPRAEFHRYLEALVVAGFGGRLMFGSDQMVWPDAFALAIEGVESADFLSAEQKRAIFYDNAARFLKLDPEQIARDHAAAR